MNNSRSHSNNENTVENVSMRILFRSAVLDDVEFLLSLRNDPSAWSQFIQARYVSKEEHFEWLCLVPL